MARLTTVELETPPGESLLNISNRVKAAVKESGVTDGICVVFVPHTTAGLVVNSGSDPATAADIGSQLRRLVPTHVDFQHTYDTPADAAGHIKVALTGTSVSLIVSAVSWRWAARSALCSPSLTGRASARCSCG